MPRIVGGVLSAPPVADEVHVDIPQEAEAPPLDVFDPPRHTPLSLEIDQKILAKAEFLSDEVERALHIMLQRKGSFEDVMACIMLYIRKKTQDARDREVLRPKSAAEKDERLAQITPHVEQLITDTQTRSRLTPDQKSQAADQIRQVWQQAGEMWKKSAVASAKPDVLKLDEDIRMMDQTLSEMMRLFHAASTRANSGQGG